MAAVVLRRVYLATNIREQDMLAECRDTLHGSDRDFARSRHFDGHFYYRTPHIGHPI
jgi:hypothetical protein